MKMRMLVFGADGQVGFELQRALRPLGEVIAASRRPLDAGRNGALPVGEGAREGFSRINVDLAEPGAAGQTIAQQGPTHVINAAAYTAVDRAEGEADVAQRINAAAVAEIGAAAQRIGAQVLHYSTDYVFPGDTDRPLVETDPTGPLGVYGISKLAGDEALIESNAEALILRVAWVYAARGSNFLATMLRLGAEREEVRIVADQFGTPTPAAWIADATAEVLRKGARGRAPTRGIYHLAPAGRTSWFGFAEEIFSQARQQGLLETLPRLVPITTADYPTPARRPAFSLLDASLLAQDFDIRLPAWQIGVAQVIAQLTTQRQGKPDVQHS